MSINDSYMLIPHTCTDDIFNDDKTFINLTLELCDQSQRRKCFKKSLPSAVLMRKPAILLTKFNAMYLKGEIDDKLKKIIFGTNACINILFSYLVHT